MKYATINEATHAWVNSFNAIQQGMIDRLMEYEPEDWSEVTTPGRGDQVYVYGCSNGKYGDGELESYNEESETYLIELEDGSEVEVERDDFEVRHYDELPMWNTMWSFGDSADDYWLEHMDGIRIMTECGFRIYESKQFGYFFGVDGAGYSFYEEHWLPLYKARGLKWHTEE